MAWYSSLFSGDSYGSGGSGSGTNWWGAILSGISSYSQSRSDSKGRKNDTKAQKEIVGLQGLEARRTSAFEKDLDYYYKQKDKLDKRRALDTYGSFSKLGTYAPDDYTLPALPVVPNKPNAG